MATNKLFKEYDQDAEDLAKALLGKVICYDGKRYMITVTEAYPYNDNYSYVNREKNSYGRNCLLKEKYNPGDCFINYNGIHFLGSRDNDSGKFNHVLIRGAIKVIGNTLEIDKYTRLNFVYGAPCCLCERLNLKGEKFFSLTKDSSALKIETFYEPKSVFTSERYNLPIPKEIKNSEDKNKYDDIPHYTAPLRYYFIPDIKLFQKEAD